ncbi:MAG: response regulator [Bryobacteraceae bacterium]|nr:response regulator [Bryobacteraceae bacterium]
MTEPVHILLAEDNPADVIFVREALLEHGIPNKMTVVANGDDVLRFFDRMGIQPNEDCPELILLDLNLPRAGGWELLARLRAHPLCALLPVVIVTSSNAPEDRQMAASLGAEYFRKPVDLDEFLKLGAVVKEVLNRDLRRHGHN